MWRFESSSIDEMVCSEIGGYNRGCISGREESVI